jgi:hypothetical protein
MVKGFAMRLFSVIALVAGVVAAQGVPPGLTPVPGTFRPLSPSAQLAPPRKDIPAIAKAANGAIVSIVMSDKDSKPIAQGSGFVVSKDGLIVTNYHVIESGSSAIVKLPDGAFFVVDGVLAFDKPRDVAVIKAHGQNFRTLTLGNSDRVQVGEEVVAIGNPLSLESTVSNGIVSGIRTVEEEGGKFLQVTTPISPGSSGGPLFNMAGDVIGITTLFLKGGENLNFAIPINDAKRLLLANSSRLKDLPNEHESASADAPPSAAGEGPQATNIARRYYLQLVYASAFSLLGKKRKGMMPTMDYACFSDDSHSDTFFTFVAIGYDQKYAELHSKWFELWLESDFQEEHKYYEQMQDMRQIGNYVYLRFMRTEEFNEYPPNVQKLYRDGAGSMRVDVYEKGVKSASLLYVNLGRSSGEPDMEWHASDAVSSHHHLAIEPSTMRYVMRNLRTGATDTSQAGVCEKIDPDLEPK